MFGRLLPDPLHGRGRRGLPAARPRTRARLRRGGGARRAGADRLPRRTGRDGPRPLAPSQLAPRGGRRPRERTRAGDRAARGDDHRLRLRLLRDPALPGRAPAGDDHAALGHHRRAAHRGARRPALPRRLPRHAGHAGPDPGHRRTGRPQLPRDHAPHGGGARPASPADPARAGAHAASELPVDPSRDARRPPHRPPAGRGTPQPRGVPRRPRAAADACSAAHRRRGHPRRSGQERGRRPRDELARRGAAAR